MTALIFALGLVTLVLGAQVLIRGASKLALSFGISPLVLGLTIVAFGTSAPELAVSVRSTWGGQVDIALGNVVGSNIFNVLFILGVSAIIAPLVLGLTIVAFGTSAPELAVSVRSTLGGQVDIALGNVVGSNIFNVLFILGVSAIIAPLVVAPQLLSLIHI